MTTKRRGRVWTDLDVDENHVGGGIGLKDLLVNAEVDLQTKTVIRCIGRLLVIPSVVANATVSAQRMTLGIGVISRESFAAAGTSVPNPGLAVEAPITGWYFKDAATLVNQQDSGTVEAWHFPEFLWDIRAARRVDRGIFFLRFQNNDLLAGTTTVKVVGLVRCLVLT